MILNHIYKVPFAKAIFFSAARDSHMHTFFRGRYSASQTGAWILYGFAFQKLGLSGHHR